MSLQGFYTTKGLALAAKIAAGTALVITRVTAGSGTETATSASVLMDEIQTLTVGPAQTSGQTATLPVTLAEAEASASYALTELGVYTCDPDEGEILYQVFRMDAPCAITAGGMNTYRFYLRQTVGASGVTVTCSPAGLLIDEDLAPTRAKVMATATNTVSAAVSAAQLQAYLDTLPRLLTDHYSITVSGTYVGVIRIHGFYGCGSLTIRADSVGSCVLTRDIEVVNCSAPVTIEKLKWQIDAAAPSSVHCITCSNCHVYAEDCSFNGYAPVNGNKVGTGMTVFAHGFACVKDCEFHNLNIAVNCYFGGRIEVYGSVPESSYSNNDIGVYLYYGGFALLGNDVPTTIGGVYNAQNGMGAIIQSGKFI